MATKPSRRHGFLITVSGVDGFFDTKSGGAKTAGNRKYFGGGNDVPAILKDRAEYADLVVGRAFSIARDAAVIARLRPVVDTEQEFTVKVQPLNADRIPEGPSTTYRGMLVGQTDPDVDSENGDPATYQLTFAIAEVL